MGYNVAYDETMTDGTVLTMHYLAAKNIDKATAELWAIKFTERYVGKQYPNGKGAYSYFNVRVVEV